MYTLEEKSFISTNRPRIHLEKIEFSPIYAEMDGIFPAGDWCFLTEEASNGFKEEFPLNGVQVTFCFKDDGASFDQKYVCFESFAQLFDTEDGTNYDSSAAPTHVFTAFADENGRFKISVPMYYGKADLEVDDEYELILKKMVADHALFQFNGVVVGNQFVAERFGTILGKMGDESFEFENVRYHLTDEYFDHEDP